MAKKNIKEKFHKLIDEWKDEESMMHAYEAVVEYKKKGKEEIDILDELTDGQRKDLEEAIRQDEAGEVITHAEMKRKIRKWLTE